MDVSPLLESPSVRHGSKGVVPMAKPKVKFKISASGMRKLEQEVASKLARDEMEYTCVGCGSVFHPSNGRIVCPSCGLEYRPQK